jgi:NAD(P)H-hydrate epimerase
VVTLSGQPAAGTPAARQLDTLERLGLEVTGSQIPEDDPDLVVDALLGYSQRGAPAGATADLVAWCAGRPVVALDTPTGLELASGRLHHPAVQAVATVTIAAAKQALRTHLGNVGTLYLGDIGVPPWLLTRAGLVPPPASPFSAGPLVEISFPSPARSRE